MSGFELPMFPLGTVLLPGAVLPLHIFEERYRALVRTVLADEADFGVVLIERGSEVGGADVRADVGTIAHIVDGHAFDDGRYALACVGTDRIRITAWLPDDPYPRAQVERWPDDPAEAPPAAQWDALEMYAMWAARQRGRGVDVPEVAFSETSSACSFEIAVMCGLGPLDAQRVLTGAGPAERLGFLEGWLRDALALMDLEDGR